MTTIEELVKSAQAGDAQAFAELVGRYERTAILTAHAILKDFHAAQDAAQDGFVLAYRRLGQLRSPATFGVWILQIVRRRALEMKEHAPQRHANLDALTPATSPPTSTGTSPDDLSEIAAIISQLPEHERIVVVRRYVDGESVEAIARATERPVNTVTKQLSRAIKRLRVLWSEVPS